jgi:lipopolysaccharide heptosyltransferase I
VRIAVVKLSSLGDVVHALPVAATVKRRAPHARLTWIVERREAALLADNPDVDEVVAIDTRSWRRRWRPRGVAATFGAVGRLRRRLRDGGFDVALDLQGLAKSGLVTAATGAPLRIGFDRQWGREGRLNALFTNRRLTPPAAARHVVEQYLSLLAPLGLGEPVREFKLPVQPRAEGRIEQALTAAGLKPRQRLVVVNPGAGRPDKRWPPERFRALAARLVDDAAASVVVVWGPTEHAAARAIADAQRGVVLAPPTDLTELIAMLRRASAMIAADTGPLHLAAAVGTPCVGLYGPTSAVRNGPYGGGHRVIQADDGRMTSIAVDAVVRLATDLLG